MSTINEGKAFGYFVDAEKAEEAERLRIQGRFLDKVMGLLPATLDLTTIEPCSVLDVGCSSGGWSSDLAARYQHIAVTGIDSSANMIRAAKARAVADKIQNRATYEIMDATKPLQFADASFDMVHGRLLFAFQTRDTWQGFISECVRLLKSGGYLIMTENDAQCWTTSPALAAFCHLGHLALYKNSNSYHREYVGIVAHLPHFIKRTGLALRSMDSYRIDIGRGSSGYSLAAKDHKVLYRGLQPYYVGLGVATQEELDILYQQMLKEIAEPDFNAYWFFTRLVAQKGA